MTSSYRVLPRTRPRAYGLRLLPVGLLLPVVLHAQTGSGPSAPPLLSFPDAVARALDHNLAIVEMRDNLEQSRLSANLAQSAFRPKVVPNILGSFGQSNLTNQAYGVSFSQRLAFGARLEANFATSGTRNQLGDYYNSDTSFLVSQPLLRGFGRGVTQREVARAEAQVAEQSRQTLLTEQQVTIEVARAYYAVVGQTLLVDVAAKTLDRAERLLEASKAKLEAGRVSQLDVSRAQQLVAEGESQVLDAKGALEDAKDRLRGLLEYDLDEDFEISHDIPRDVEPMTVEQAVQTALGNRLERDGAREALAEAERSVVYGRNQLLPQFDVKVGLTRQGTAETFADSLGTNDFNLTYFFAASVPVDRTPAQTDYHNSLIERDRRRRAVTTTERRIAEDARRAARRQARLLQSLDVARSRLEFAEQELDVATLRFTRGLANNLDVVNAEVNVLSSRSRHISLLADLAVARLELLSATGVLDPRADVIRTKDAESPNRSHPSESPHDW